MSGALIFLFLGAVVVFVLAFLFISRCILSIYLSRRRVLDKSSAVTRGDWSREWSSQRSDEAHVTTPGGPDNRIEEDGVPSCVTNSLNAARECDGGPLYYKDVLTRFYLEFFYPHDSERECDRTIGSFSHQSEITREQLSLPLASPPSPPGIRGILWVVQSIDLWRVSQPHFEGAMKYSDRHLAGLSAGPPDRVELIGAGSLG